VPGAFTPPCLRPVRRDYAQAGVKAWNHSQLPFHCNTLVKEVSEGQTSVVSLTLLYNDPRVIIPAPYQVRDKLQRESRSKALDSPVSSTGQAYQVRNDKMCKVISETLH